jgi:hypothetical protein
LCRISKISDLRGETTRRVFKYEHVLRLDVTMDEV